MLQRLGWGGAQSRSTTIGAQLCGAAADGIGVAIGYHMVAHTRRGWRGVVEPGSARWLWDALREAFPEAFGASLLPDHVHLSDASDDIDAFVRVLERHGRRHGARWDRGPLQECNTVAILARALRYIILNAVRDGWVRDPWCWPWSTLRDLCDAVVDPWTPLEAIALACRQDPADLLAFVCSDTDLPARIPTPSVAGCIPDLASVAAATASALRAQPADIRRRGPARSLFVQLAFACGAPRPAELATWCDATVRTIWNARATPDPIALQAARLCLTDPRLHIHDVDTSTRPCTALRPDRCNTRRSA